MITVLHLGCREERLQKGRCSPQPEEENHMAAMIALSVLVFVTVLMCLIRPKWHKNP